MKSLFLQEIDSVIIRNTIFHLHDNLKRYSMIMKKEISKEITDASFGEVLRQLSYKCLLKGKYFYQFSTYYPSSQMCSVCENIDKKYKCSKCNNTLDRDYNASINIMFEEIKLYMKEIFS